MQSKLLVNIYTNENSLVLVYAGSLVDKGLFTCFSVHFQQENKRALPPVFISC